MRSWSFVLAVLFVVTAGLALWEAATDAVTIDEPVYITAGTTALARQDLRLNPQHPPLSKILAAAPLLADEPVLPVGSAWAHHHQRSYSRAFMEDLRNRGELRESMFLSRLVPIVELVLTGLLVYMLAARLGGRAGGTFATALWLLNPFVLGIGHLDGIDIPFTLVALAVALAVLRWLEVRSPARLAVVGLACGAALVTRDSGPLLLLVAAATLAVAARRPLPVLAVIGLAGLVVWLVYAPLDPAFTFHHPNVLPQRYIDGFDALADAHGGPTGVYVLGRHWTKPPLWIWPLSMVLKLPITLLAAFALAPFFLRRVGAEARRRVLIAVLPAAMILAAFTVATPVFLGLRYMLPVIALMCVAVAPLVRAPRLVPLVLVAGSAFFTATSAPHSIAWIAPPFHPGYRVTTDSNLDWGQDVYALQHWAKGKRAWIACYSPKGSGCVAGAPGTRPLGKHPDPRRIHGWVAISSTLMNLDGWDPWLRRYRPAGTIDGTVLLYRIPASRGPLLSRAGTSAPSRGA